jgi:TolB-like protein
MQNLIRELKTRNVFRVGVAYTISAWLLAQVADLVSDTFAAPAWIMQILVILLLIGLPLALFLAWAYELTPAGIVKANEVPEGAAKDPAAGRILNRLILLALVIAVAWLAWDRFRPSTETPPAPIADKSIAVLPFADFSPDKDQAWFADGLTDEILNALARTRDLRVASRTSSFAFRGSDKDMRQIGAELNVAHVLEGSVRRAGERLRVTAQLIRVADDAHLWSDTFDRSVEDSIEIQETIALEIAKALQTAMDPDELEKMLSAGTSSVAAWELYLQAEALFGTDQTDLSEMLQLLETAVGIDPQFVDAYITIANLWLTHLSPSQTGRFSAVASRSEARQRFYAAVDMARQFARSEVDRAKYMGIRARFDVRLLEFERASETVARQEPEKLESWANLGYAKILIGDYAGARDALLKGKAISLETGESPYQVYQYLHRVDVAAAYELANATMQRPSATNQDIYQAHRVFLYAGQVEQAARLAQLYSDRSDDLSSILMVNIRQACAEDRVADADDLYSQMDEAVDGGLGDNIWLFLKTLGRDDEANELLRPLDTPEGMYTLSSFLNYTHFDPTIYPRFSALLAAQGIERPPAATIPFACVR